MKRISCCVAVMAYNEEANIGKMLKALCQQRLTHVQIAEIIVVASGCVDRTEGIVRQFCRRDARVRLISQKQRQGKSSAVNTLLRNTRQEVIVLANADTIPAPEAIEHLVAPFHDPEVGMTGGRPVPTNDPHTFTGYMIHLLWQLHHQISLRRPKMGELIAFRNFFRQIPRDSAVDEASIEPLIRGQGLRLRYVPEAVVYNRGPETVEDFLRQRRRIYAGHVYVRDTLGYRVSTMKGRHILWLLLTAPGIRRDWRYFLWGPAVIGLEVWGRLLGVMDYRVWKRKHAVWEVAKTTKVVAAPSLGPSESAGS
ncbi:MAG TPA: glycosyltransferase [Anaerolineales bacterium]|nr:glycosyltransferase [Anaerolineae bacterium]HIQ02457.1 glycosyltransferase [Anaerolineales bacterium]